MDPFPSIEPLPGAEGMKPGGKLKPGGGLKAGIPPPGCPGGGVNIGRGLLRFSGTYSPLPPKPVTGSKIGDFARPPGVVSSVQSQYGWPPA